MRSRFWMEPPTTRIEQSAWILRDKIMRGALRPGDRLVEQQAAAALSISRASLREVLRMLEAERLIELAPNRGYSVARLDAADVADIHKVWALLTGEAVADFATRATDADIAAVRDVPDRMRAAAHETRTLVALINRFFGAILDGCGNVVLRETVWDLVARINVLRAWSLDAEVARRWAGEFDALLAALAERRADRARACVEAHIAGACECAQAAVDRARSSRDRAAMEPEDADAAV